MSYDVIYGKFEYEAGSWDYPRRVVFKIEKPFGQMIHLYTFVVTNMDSSPEELIRFYCKRGQMENFIKESKIAARIVRKARYVVFKLCSSCPFQHKFYETFYNIRQIQPLTES